MIISDKCYIIWWLFFYEVVGEVLIELNEVIVESLIEMMLLDILLFILEMLDIDELFDIVELLL